MNQKTTILIVEDHSIITDGIRSILKSKKANNSYEIVGEAKNAEEAYKLFDQLQPQLVLADISLEGQEDGIMITRSLVAKQPNVKVLMLSMHATADYVYESMLSGAAGYLTKENASEELLKAMKTVLRGEEYLDPTIHPSTVKSFADICRDKESREENTAALSYSLLSPREQEVFRLLADGQKIADIALALDRSPKTIDNHRAKIFSKLNLKKNVDLYKYAVRIGMVDPDF